jgi:hypothetical protein
MTGEIMRVVACSGSDYRGNPTSVACSITTLDVANAFGISDFVVVHKKTYDDESGLPVGTWSNNPKNPQFSYGSGSVEIVTNQGDNFVVVLYPRYDPNPQGNHANGDPHFNFDAKLIRLDRGQVVDEKSLSLPQELHTMPYDKIRTDYYTDGLVFACHIRTAPSTCLASQSDRSR